MLTQQIADLKRKLQEEKNFTAILDAFFDIQEGNADFVKKSKPRKAKLLEKAICAGAGAAIGKTLRMGQFVPLEHRETGLIHGFYMTKAGAGSFFFFNDIRMGMGMLQVGPITHTFRIRADLWNEKGESVPGEISDIDVDQNS
jgi:hypothetical protein